MTKKIRIPYFPTGLKYVTPFLFGAAIYLATLHRPIWALLLILLALLVLTTNYITEINLQEKKYRDYLSLLGFAINEDAHHFTSVEKIIITKGNHAQMINTRSQSRQLDWTDYTGTLILDNEKTLDLLTKNDKRELLDGIKDIAAFLQVGVEDQSSGRHYWVDFEKV